MKNSQNIEPISDKEQELIDACRTGNIETVQTLLNEEVDFNKVGKYGDTALSTAIHSEQYKIARLLFEKDANLVKVQDRWGI